MNVWKVFKKTISVVLTLAIALGLAAPVFAEVATLSSGSIGYLAMGDGMTEGIGLKDQVSDAYAANVAKALYGDNWENSYRLRADSKYRVEELRYLIDTDYSGDGYTEQFFGTPDTEFERDKKDGSVRDEVASADYITISAGVNNFSTYIVEQMLYYVENGGAVKYSYDIESVLSGYAVQGVDMGDAYAEFEDMKAIVKNELMAAAGDTMDKGVELVDFVAEVSAYAMLSYIVSFNALVDEIYALNPDVELYVIGIYNAMEGEVLSVTVNGQYHDVEIGQFFGALLEIANAYTQILAPRVYDYTYVHPGSPELLIDVMGDDSLTTEERIPDGLKTKLLESAEDTAIEMIQEMYAQYGVEKSTKEAEDLAYEIFEAETAEERLEIIKSEINDMAIEEVLDRFEKELENYAGTYGNIDISGDDILNLLSDMEAAEKAAEEAGATEEEVDAALETVATDFVVDLMTKAMAGQTFAGIKIETQEDAYEAIALLEKNAASAGGDPAAIREAAAAMVIAEIGEDNILGIDEADVVELLELMDVQTTTEAREEVVDAWLNEKAAEYICTTVQQYVASYTLADAKELLAEMEASDSDDDAAIAKEHLLKHFTPVLADKMEEKYTEGGFTLQNYASFEAFAHAINTEDDVKTVVREEIRAAAAVAIHEYATGTTAEDEGGNTLPLWSSCQCVGTHDPETCSGLSLAMIQEMLTTMDSKSTQEEKDEALQAWMVKYMCGGSAPVAGSLYERLFFNPVKAKFLDAYNSYNDAATTAENMCANYRDSLDKASDAFGSYADLKAQAADTIIKNYEESYQGAGATAQQYYTDYLALRDAAVSKVMSGYKEYANAINKGLSSCDKLNEVFDNVFIQLCEIAEVEAISLNDILSVAKKAQTGGYVQGLVNDLIQGETLAKDAKTVAYLALRYYLADSMMIMPSASGHKTIANQIIKAINGEDTYSTGGYYANKVIDKAIDVYKCANAYRNLSSSESGQVDTLINPALYVALGDNVTSGSALDDASLAYPKLVGDALAMAADDRDGGDKVQNYAINGMRVEELLMLVDDSYNGDEYTAERFGTADIQALRDAYADDIANAELITINVGINNMVTYPLVQTMLAYNGETPYEMDWGRFIGDSRANKIDKGMAAAKKLTLFLVDNAESRSETLDDLSAYERCERALNTMFTAVESMVYSYISYIFTLDDAVEQIAALNEDATIALIGFYNPLEDTYFQVDRTVTVRGKTVDLSQYEINVDKLADMMLNLANRYLANYVGSISENGTAADEGSRLLNVKINDTELFVTNDSTVSKDLSHLVEWKDFTLRGKTLTVYVPEYFLQSGRTAGDCLHPNEAGHEYIADQILAALDFEIYADVIVDNYTKTYGDADPDYSALIDDLSSLWSIEVTGITREAGEEVGTYQLSALYEAEDGYKEIDEEFGTLEIVQRDASITVTVKDGVITAVAYDNVLEADQYLLTASDLTLSGSIGAYEVTVDSSYITKNYNLTIEIVEEVTIGQIQFVNPSLNLESEVHYNFDYKLVGFDMNQVVEMGLLKFNTRTDDLADSNMNTADEVITGAVNMGEYYRFRSNGVDAKNLDDDAWYRCYVIMSDGQIVYGSRVKFDAREYARRALIGNYSTELKSLCVSLMNYGAAAQEYFAETTDYEYTELMTAFLDTTDYSQYKSLVIDFADHMIDERVAAEKSKHGEFKNPSNDIFYDGYKANLSLEGAFTLNIAVPYAAESATKSGMLIWSEADYLAAEELTWDNVTEHYEVPVSGAINVPYEGIAAKNMDDTIFCCGYVEIDGEYYYTSIFRLSVDNYAEKILDGSYTDTMKTLAEYTVVYGEYAYNYFY